MVTFEVSPLEEIERFTMSWGKDCDARGPHERHVRTVAYKSVALLEIPYFGSGGMPVEIGGESR